MEDRIVLRANSGGQPGQPDGATGALANEYNKAERHEDEAAVLERYVATHEQERTTRQHESQIRFRARLTEIGAEQVEGASA